MNITEIACLLVGLIALVIASVSLVRSRKLGSQFKKLDSMIDEEIAKDENGLTAKMQVYFHKTIEPKLAEYLKASQYLKKEVEPLVSGAVGRATMKIAAFDAEMKGIVGMIQKHDDELVKIQKSPTFPGDLTVGGTVYAQNVRASGNVQADVDVIAMQGLIGQDQLVVSGPAQLQNALLVGGPTTVGSLTDLSKKKKQ